MSQPSVLIDSSQPAITILTLNRPDRRNALTIPLMQELCAAIEAAGRDETQRVIILRGAGPVFCSGLDLKEASEPAQAERAVEAVGRLMETVHQSPRVTIAAVNGAAVAGGAGLMSACDFVVAADDARFGYPEVHRGLIAAVVMTFLRRQLRERDARELLLLGELIDARRALAIGLINRAVPPAEVMNESLRLAKQVMKAPPITLARTKQALDELWPTSVSEDVKRALQHHLATRGSDEAKEGIAAFLEKRPPHWAP